MTFSCDLDDESGEHYEVVNSSVDAEVERKCCECGYTINAGEIHSKWYGVKIVDDEDGNEAEEETGEEYYTCERCADLEAAFLGAGYCIIFGEFFHDYAEWLDERLPMPSDEDIESPGRSRAQVILLKHRTWSTPQ